MLEFPTRVVGDPNTNSALLPDHVQGAKVDSESQKSLEKRGALVRAVSYKSDSNHKRSLTASLERT